MSGARRVVPALVLAWAVAACADPGGHLSFASALRDRVESSVGQTVAIADLAPFDWTDFFVFAPCEEPSVIRAEINVDWAGAAELKGGEYCDVSPRIRFLVVFTTADRVTGWDLLNLDHGPDVLFDARWASPVHEERTEARFRISQSADGYVLDLETGLRR
jgi:hypothetical protein